MFALPVASEDVDAYRLAMERFHPVGFRAMARASAEDLSDVPLTIDVPTLLIFGGRDERAPSSVGEGLLATIPASRLVVLPNAGHVCNLELPGRFNDEVRVFLRGVS